MIERILRLIRMDFSVFKEIESDPSDTTEAAIVVACLLYTSPSPRDATLSRMPSSA